VPLGNAARRPPLRTAAVVASTLGPVAIACVLGLVYPRDPVWFAFTNVGVLLASVLRNARVALVVALMALICVIATTLVHLTELGGVHVVTLITFNLMFSALIVLSARYREHLEAVREDRLRASENKLSESRRMESIGRLAGGIAHDFNNLLTVVLANAELLARGRTIDMAAHEIEAAGTRAAELTRQLLAYARQQVTTPVIVSSNEVLANLEPILRRLLREDIQLTIVPDPGLWPIKVDPSQLEQVILNLTVNARDALPQGGRIEVSTHNVTRRDPIERELSMLCVRDSGSGMNRETLAHVFEPFFTTKSPGIGTGLGLATVQSIVQEAGGFVEVDSAPGEGSEFRIYLPHAKGGQRTASVRPSGPQGLLVPRTSVVLLVEDDALVRKSVARMLEDAGMEVLQAASAVEARGLFVKHRPRIEVLLTDVVLTDASGIELAEVLQERVPKLRVLLMTGYADELTQRATELKPDWLLLTKPFAPRDLMAALASAIGESGPAAVVELVS